MLYIDRKYRNFLPAGSLDKYQVKYKDSDLLVYTREAFYSEAMHSLVDARNIIEDYIYRHPRFKESMIPLDQDDNAPPLIKTMFKVSSICGVGPMASIAGAIAGEVGNSLLSYSEEVIIENGGDIYLRISGPKTVGIFAAESPFNMKIGLKLKPSVTPFAVCTSSGTVGHSLSYGNADAVVCVADDCALADAAATSIGNSVKGVSDIASGLERFRDISGLKGCVIIIGDHMAADGDIEICKLN